MKALKQMCETAFEELVHKVESGQSEQMRSYMSIMARFHRYSLNNIFLIHAQMPKATKVAGFHTWRKLGRFVKKDERGIGIMAPVVYHRKDMAEADDLQKELEMIKTFRTVYVFDLSQTGGKALPEPAKVGGEPGPYLQGLRDYILGAGVRLEYRDDLQGADGMSCRGTIKVKKGLSCAEEFSILCHEWAHERLHQAEALDRRTAETEAEAVAYIVSQGIGLDTNTSASDYIQNHKGDKAALLASMKRIHETASELLSGLLDDKLQAA